MSAKEAEHLAEIEAKEQAHSDAMARQWERAQRKEAELETAMADKASEHAQALAVAEQAHSEAIAETSAEHAQALAAATEARRGRRHPPRPP